MGNPCELSDNTTGICTPIEKCNWIQTQLKKKKITTNDITQCFFEVHLIRLFIERLLICTEHISKRRRKKRTIFCFYGFTIHSWVFFLSQSNSLVCFFRLICLNSHNIFFVVFILRMLAINRLFAVHKLQHKMHSRNLSLKLQCHLMKKM